MISHIMATSQPPPRAYPFTAAMVGLVHLVMQFQWFKKDRKSYRDADILNLEPVQSVQLSEAFHSENPNNKDF